MASTVEKTEAAEVPPPPPPASWCSSSMLDPLLRLLLLASSIVAVVVMVTGNETQLIYNPLVAGGKVPVPAPAKWRYSPAFVYFVAALSVAGLYSIISVLASLSNLYKPCSVPTKTLLILITFDVLLLGIVASAVGTAGGVAYIGLKGNKHVNWGKICNTYGKFCRYTGSSIAVALFASVVLLLLIFGNTCTLYRRAESKP